MTPTIVTGRLRLKVITRSSQRQVDWLRDGDVVRYSEQRHDQHTLSTQLRYVSHFIGLSNLWGVYLAETGEHIGNLSATRDEPNNVAEVGILIGEKKFWGMGYGAEAWKAACDWLLDKNGGAARKLEAGCMKSNLAMVKIITGSKFTEEGERKNHFLFNSDPISMVLYGRFR